MDYEIFALGDPAFLAETLKATTTIMARDDLGDIVAIGFLITFVWIIVQGILSGGSEIKIQNIGLALLIYTAFFGVKVDTVTVWSQTTMEFHQVEGVPLGLAFTGTVISKVGNSLTDWFEQEYTMIGVSTSEMGTGFALKALYEMRGLGFADGSLKWDPNGHLTKTLDNYIKDCVVPGTTIGTYDPAGVPIGLPAIDLKKVAEKESAWAHLKWNNNVFTTKVYPYLTADPTPADKTQILPCALAYDYITSEYVTNADVINRWMTNIGEAACNEAGYSCEAFKTPTGEFNQASFATSFNVIRDSIMTSDVNLDKFMMNRALLLGLSRLKTADLGSGDALISAVTSRASAQITANQALQQTMFEKMMLPLMTFFEALMYVAAPFAAILIAFGVGGIGMIGKYLIFALWIQLWKPVAAVGNLFVQMSVSGEMSNLSKFAIDQGNSLSAIANQPEVFDTLQHWIGVGGMLVASTPVITLMLMYGSAVTASSLASRIDMGKGATVGMDDFTGKSQIGDAKKSLTSEGGQVATGNDQTIDATKGHVSMAATMNNQAQQASALASSETKKAEVSRGRALEQLTAAGTGVTERNSTAQNASGQVVNSQEYAESQAQKLVEKGEIAESDRSTVATGINAKATAGADLGKLMGQLKSNKVNTSGVKSPSHLGMIMKALGGKIEGGASYQDTFDKAAAETSSLADVVDQTWQDGESERKSWTQGFANADEDSITQTQEWKDAAKASEQWQESTARADSAEQRASTLKSLAGTSGYQQRYELATLSADAGTKQGMRQFGQFLEAKAQQGDTTYAGMDANPGDYRKAVMAASGNGKMGDMAELFDIAGKTVDDPMPMMSVGALKQQMHDESGSPSVQGSGPTVSGGAPLSSISTDRGMGFGSLDPSAREGRAAAFFEANPEVDPENMTLAQSQAYMESVGMLDEGEFTGVEKDPEAIAEKVNNAMEDSDIREVGGKGKALMDFLDTGIIQQAQERSTQAAEAGAIAAGAGMATHGAMTAMALKQGGKAVAMGMIRGAATGVFRGGAWGAVAGAAYGAAEGYMAYRETVDQGQAGQELTGALQGNGDLSQITNESQEVINNTLEGVIAKQVTAMDQAASAGKEFDVEEFRNNELNDFERQVHESAETLMTAGNARSDGTSYGDELGDTFANAIDNAADANEAKEMGYLTGRY